ncbi:hypothetical protein PMIN04_011972 [Paraphaeosphaeria minitans]
MKGATLQNDASVFAKYPHWTGSSGKVRSINYRGTAQAFHTSTAHIKRHLVKAHNIDPDTGLLPVAGALLEHAAAVAGGGDGVSRGTAYIPCCCAASSSATPSEYFRQRAHAEDSSRDDKLDLSIDVLSEDDWDEVRVMQFFETFYRNTKSLEGDASQSGFDSLWVDDHLLAEKKTYKRQKCTAQLDEYIDGTR